MSRSGVVRACANISSISTDYHYCHSYNSTPQSVAPHWLWSPFVELCNLSFSSHSGCFSLRNIHRAFAPPKLHRPNISTCKLMLSPFLQTLLRRRYLSRHLERTLALWHI